jgi:hypothetical protein
MKEFRQSLAGQWLRACQQVSELMNAKWRCEIATVIRCEKTTKNSRQLIVVVLATDDCILCE